MRSSSAGGSAERRRVVSQRTIAGLVAIFLAGLFVAALVSPIVLRGEPPGPFEVLVAAGELLLVGFVLRTRRSQRVQSIGFWILIGALAAFGVALFLVWQSVITAG